MKKLLKKSAVLFGSCVIYVFYGLKSNWLGSDEV